MSTTADQRDERLLKHLEARLAAAKERLKMEDEEAEKVYKAHARSKDGEFDPEDYHNVYFWHKVLPHEDRSKLAALGINSMQELYLAYQEADETIKKPPQPAAKDLPPRLRFAYELYENIPSLIAAAQHNPKPKSPFWNTQERMIKGFI